MKNQVDSIRGFGESDAVAHFLELFTDQNTGDDCKGSDVTSGKTKMLYVAPETLKKEETVEFLALCQSLFRGSRRSALHK